MSAEPVLINGKLYTLGGVVAMHKREWREIPRDCRSTKPDGTRFAIGNVGGATVLVRVEVFGS